MLNSKIQLMAQFRDWADSNEMQQYSSVEEVLADVDIDFILTDEQEAYIEQWQAEFDAAPDYNAVDVLESLINGQFEQAKQQGREGSVTLLDFVAYLEATEHDPRLQIEYIKKLYGTCEPYYIA